MAYQLKPFVINLGDLSYLLKQINFRPLFDANGNAIVNWDGVGSVYTANNTEIFGGLVAGDAASLLAIQNNGVGFPSTTAPIGIRDVSGYHNNLYGTQADWGRVDEVFRRDTGADFINYIKPVDGGSYLANNGGLNPNATLSSNYTTTVAGNVVTQSSVVDYTPRMISRTITTGGVNLLADANGHYVAWDSARYASDSVYAALVDGAGVNITQLVEGAKIVAPVTTELQLLNAHGEAMVWNQAQYTLSGATGTTLAVLFGSSIGGLFGNATGGPLQAGGPVFAQFTLGTYTQVLANYDLDLIQYKGLVDLSGADIAALQLAGDGTPVTYTAQASSGYGLLETLGHIDFQNPTSGEFFIGSENPGVSPVNSWFAIFGQFFDHGLDKLSAGGQGKTIKIALALDDPLYGVIGQDGQPVTSINISRATVVGVDANGDPTFKNSTSPFIDQSQTYGSHEQMTQLLREWIDPDGNGTFSAGMKLFDGTTLADAWERRWPDGTTSMVNDTLPTLSELRDHVLDTGRDALSWEDVTNLRNRDVVTGDLSTGNSGQALLLDMNPRFDAAHLDATTDINGTSVDTLIDAAVATLAGATPPGFTFGRIGGGTSGGIELTVTGGAGGPYLPDGTYTGANALALWVNFSNFSITAPAGAVHDAVGQILMAAVGDHYIAGDGRVNENFGLTAIHHVFHEEHNYQVENLKGWIYAHDTANTPGDHAGLHEWQINTGTQDASGNYIYANGSVAWDSDKMFNGSKLIVEMEYQHAAVDQYARTITPRIQEFVGYSSSVDSTISLEYSQVAFRFGHSTIRETIDTIDPSGWFKGAVTTYALEAAFLTPQTFADEGVAAITLGLSRQQMSEVDEFITPALNQGLLGLPLDLAAINIARGRDMGIPTLNDFRAAIGLTRYISWTDFGLNMIHPESLVNFLAAYGLDGDVALAAAIVGIADGSVAAGTLGVTLNQALAVMNNDAAALAGNTALLTAADAFNHIDSWMGGLAEAHVPGGLLGETFDAVFVAQIQSLMDGDRFYYLYRLFGTQIGEEVNNGQFKDIVERNTGLSHLNGSIFAYADKYYDFGQDADQVTAGVQDNYVEHGYANLIAAHATDANGTDNSGDANVGVGIFSDGGVSTANNGVIVTVGGVQYINDIRPELDPAQVHTVEGTPTSGADSHEVMVGTEYRDFINARGGDDTIYGEAGDDILNGGGGIDRIYGGAGNDVIDAGEGPDLIDGGAGDDTIYGRGSGSEVGGFDQLVGGGGNDLIIGGEGIDKLSGGAGDDVLFGDGIVFSEMGNTDPFTHGGDGNDYIDGGASGDLLYGDEGDDLVVGSQDQDIVQGNVGDDILRPGNPSAAINGGPDEVIGDDGYTNTGFDMIDFSDYVAGADVNADMVTQFNPLVNIDNTTTFPAWFQIEGVIGSQNNDTLIGTGAFNPAEEANLFGGGNWLIGGSGNDTLQGNGGNDLIVGDGVRLDSLIGTYSGTYTMYDTYADANYRNTGTLQNNGLLDFVGFDKHYTEMLSSAIFQNIELGGSIIGTLNGVAGTRQGDGGTAGAADTVVFTGNRAEYTVEVILFATANQGTITAFKITDNVSDRDGVDVVVGIENFKFDDVTLTPATVVNEAPVIDGGATAAANFAENSAAAVGTVTAVDLNGDTLTYTIAGGADAGLFTINAATGELSFASPPNFEAAADVGANNVYDVVVQVSDGLGGLDTQAIAVTVTNVNEAVITLPVISDSTPTAGQALTVSLPVDLDGALSGVTYQWASSSDGTTWTNIAGATGATFTPVDNILALPDPQAGQQLQVVVNYTAGGFAGSATSAATGPVGANWTALTAATFTGTAGDDIANGSNPIFFITSGNDTLNGNAGNDILNGNGGNDSINGGADNDSINGGAGNDTITQTGATGGRDFVDGGAGTVDTYVLNGDATAETFNIYTNAAAVLAGFSGLNANTEIVVTRNGVIVAELDNIEEITVNTLNVTANNGGGLDTVGAGDTINVFGNFASPNTSLNYSTITVNGSGNNDTVDITGLESAHRIVFSTNGGEDVLIGARTQDVMMDTSVEGTDGDDALMGGVGSDLMHDNEGADTIRGSDGNDVVIMDDDDTADYVRGGAGNDTIDFSALSSNLTVRLNGSNDTTVYGSGTGNDVIRAFENFIGGSGDDAIRGDSGANRLNGGAGNDTITGGAGADILTGGLGADTFVYGTGGGINGSGVGVAARDLITDFVSGTDKLDFSGIDADFTSDGNQAFVFNDVAGAAFTGAGQLTYRYEGSGDTAVTVIQGNVNADLATDFEVALTGHITFNQATDLVL